MERAVKAAVCCAIPIRGRGILFLVCLGAGRKQAGGRKAVRYYRKAAWNYGYKGAGAETGESSFLFEGGYRGGTGIVCGRL